MNPFFGRSEFEFLLNFDYTVWYEFWVYTQTQIPTPNTQIFLSIDPKNFLGIKKYLYIN